MLLQSPDCIARRFYLRMVSWVIRVSNCLDVSAESQVSTVRVGNLPFKPPGWYEHALSRVTHYIRGQVAQTRSEAIQVHLIIDIFWMEGITHGQGIGTGSV